MVFRTKFVQVQKKIVQKLQANSVLDRKTNYYCGAGHALGGGALQGESLQDEPRLRGCCRLSLVP
ncbi:MAG: hypothetical protein AMJ89_05590 [candidate division Zixibacteria bacterium SM23_73]|nr:MAG: hypothetical protein AMJ89_05590 [candidate division Zixibacteria bacterium SM23_73]